jgi:hypothetical protein
MPIPASAPRLVGAAANDGSYCRLVSRADQVRITSGADRSAGNTE